MRFFRFATLVPSAFAVLAAHAALQAGCSDPPQKVAYDTEVIRIGVIQSLTGSDGAVGPPLKNAAAVAEWQINAAGGVLGKRVELVVEDDASKSDQATAAADRLLNLGVAAVIGPTTSGNATALAPKFFDGKTLLISSTALATGLTTAQPPRDRFFFRTIPPADTHGRVLADAAAKGPTGPAGRPLCKKMSMLVTDDATGNSFAAAARAEMVLRGGTIIDEVKVKTDVANDYRQEIAQLMGTGAPKYECLGLFVFTPVGVQFMRDYVAALPKTAEWQRTYVLAWNVLYTAAFINNGRIDPADPSKGTVAEGVVGIVVDPEPQTPEYGEFRRQYTALFPAEVTAAKGKLARNTANTFDAAVLVALAMERAKTSTDRIAIRDALFDVSRGGTVFTPGQIPEAMAAIRRGDDVDYKGASGAVDFDDTGNVKSDFVTWEVKDGAFVSRDRIEAKDVQ